VFAKSKPTRRRDDEAIILGPRRSARTTEGAATDRLVGRPVSLLHSYSPFFSSADLPQGDRPRRRVSPTSRSGRRWERWHGGSGTTSTAGFFADSAQAANVSATLSLITRAWVRAQRNRDTDSRRACDPRRSASSSSVIAPRWRLQGSNLPEENREKWVKKRSDILMIEMCQIRNNLINNVDFIIYFEPTNIWIYYIYCRKI